MLYQLSYTPRPRRRLAVPTVNRKRSQAATSKRKHGFCGMIAKPYEIDALGRAVSEALAAAEKEQEKVIHLDFAEQQSGAA